MFVSRTLYEVELPNVVKHRKASYNMIKVLSVSATAGSSLTSKLVFVRHAKSETSVQRQPLHESS